MQVNASSVIFSKLTVFRLFDYKKDKNPLKNDMKQHLMVWLLFWNSGSTVYSFIAITPRSTLTLSGSIWSGPIYGSNRSVWKLLVLANTWNNCTKISTTQKNVNIYMLCMRFPNLLT